MARCYTQVFGLGSRELEFCVKRIRINVELQNYIGTFLSRNHGKMQQLSIWAWFLGAGSLREKYEEACGTPTFDWEFLRQKLWEDNTQKYLGLVPGS